MIQVAFLSHAKNWKLRKTHPLKIAETQPFFFHDFPSWRLGRLVKRALRRVALPDRVRKHRELTETQVYTGHQGFLKIMHFKLKGNQHQLTWSAGPAFHARISVWSHEGSSVSSLFARDSVVLLVEAFQYRSAILNPKE